MNIGRSPDIKTQVPGLIVLTLLKDRGVGGHGEVMGIETNKQVVHGRIPHYGRLHNLIRINSRLCRCLGNQGIEALNNTYTQFFQAPGILPAERYPGNDIIPDGNLRIHGRFN